MKLVFAGAIAAGATAPVTALHSRGPAHPEARQQHSSLRPSSLHMPLHSSRSRSSLRARPHSSKSPASQHGNTPVGPQPLGISGHWKLILNADFSGTSLDTDIWRPDWFGNGITGPINANETACYRPGNVSLPGDGTVHLAVTTVPSRCHGVTRAFSGAVLSTNPHDGRTQGGFEYTFGVLQARVYVPGSGSTVADWPAVLTLGQDRPKDGEDDIMENLEGAVCSHFHSPGYAPGGDLGGCDPFFRPGWHTVTANWEPGSVTWYYDGIQLAHITKGVTFAPMYIVLVNSVSSKAPGIARPSAMRIQYVRVWQAASYAPQGRPKS